MHNEVLGGGILGETSKGAINKQRGRLGELNKSYIKHIQGGTCSVL